MDAADFIESVSVPQGKLPAAFSKRAIELKAQSEKEGRPIYEERDFITIFLNGGDVVDREVKPKDKIDYAQAWAAYEQGQSQKCSGTPVNQWPVLGVAQIATLRALNVFSVEQIAEASDALLQSIGMGAREMQAKARIYLQKAATNAKAEAAVAENVRLKEEIADLKKQISDLAKQIKEKH